MKRYIFRMYLCGINLKLYTVVPASSKEEALDKLKDPEDRFTYKFWKVIE